MEQKYVLEKKDSILIIRELAETEPGKSSVIRFSRQTLLESLRFIERFLPFHLEKDLMSLKFLNTIRGNIP